MKKTNVHKYDVQLIEKGIYYLKGEFFPIQFIVTKDLTNEQNLWLHNLTNDIHDTDVAKAVSEKDVILAEKDNILAEKDAYIKQLEAQLGIAYCQFSHAW